MKIGNYKSNIINITPPFFEFSSVRYERDDKKDGNFYDKRKKTLHLTTEAIEILDNLKIGDEKVFDVWSRYIRPRGFVGVIKVNDLLIEILPKFLKYHIDKKSIDIVRRNILFMLDYVFPNLNVASNIAELKKTEDLDILELFIYIFSKNLLNLLKIRLYRDYVRRQENTKFIRGRLLFNKYNLATPHIIPCEYFEYSLDNIINRILKYTCYVLLKLTKTPQNYWLLKQILSILSDVQLVTIRQKDFDNIEFNRLNIDFKMYIDFCKLLLSNVSTTLEPSSDVKFFSFLIPMHELFEKFIAEVIKRYKEELIGRDAKIYAQKYIGHIVIEKGKEKFRLKPDIIIKKNGRVYIIDTKYKLIKTDVSREDIYQMYIYGYRANSHKIILLYPEHLYSRNKTLDLVYHNRTAKLYIRTVNLSIDLYNNFSKFLSNLKEVLNVLEYP